MQISLDNAWFAYLNNISESFKYTTIVLKSTVINQWGKFSEMILNLLFQVIGFQLMGGWGCDGWVWVLI